MCILIILVDLCDVCMVLLHVWPMIGFAILLYSPHSLSFSDQQWGVELVKSSSCLEPRVRIRSSCTSFIDCCCDEVWWLFMQYFENIFIKTVIYLGFVLGFMKLCLWKLFPQWKKVLICSYLRVCMVLSVWFRLTWHCGSGVDLSVMVPVTDPGLGRYKEHNHGAND